MVNMLRKNGGSGDLNFTFLRFRCISTLITPRLCFLFSLPQKHRMSSEMFGHSAPNISHGGRQELDSSAIVDFLLT